MRNIVIIGGGFAGISALGVLSRQAAVRKNGFNLILLDKKKDFEFIPVLPDIAGGWLHPDRARASLEMKCRNSGATFINAEVLSIDMPVGKVLYRGGELDYEYLIVASGSETNFFGNGRFREFFYSLDNIPDAVKIRKNLLERSASGDIMNVVIAGGGYTGIELATNIRFLLNRSGSGAGIFIVEKGPEILAPSPPWMKKAVSGELRAMDIEVIVSSSVKDTGERWIEMDNGRRIDNAIGLWSAGVRTPGFIEGLDFPKERTRVTVDEYLMPGTGKGKGVFIAGDSASFRVRPGMTPLRMSVVFALSQGSHAAINVVRSILGKRSIPYRPVDPGYLIPVATGKAPGTVLGVNVGGRIGYFLHYFMCVYRSEPSNRGGIINDLVKRRIEWRKRP